MPAEAGIQSVGDNNNFKDLDFRFRGNDGVSPITAQSLAGEGRVRGGTLKSYEMDTGYFRPDFSS